MFRKQNRAGGLAVTIKNNNWYGILMYRQSKQELIMMNKLSVLLIFIAGAATIGCSDVKRKPGDIYMPDMAYSRAYETYIERDSTVFTDDPLNKKDEVFYNNRSVP